MINKQYRNILAETWYISYIFDEVSYNKSSKKNKILFLTTNILIRNDIFLDYTNYLSLVFIESLLYTSEQKTDWLEWIGMKSHSVRKVWAPLGLQTILCVEFGRLSVSKP